MEIKYDCIKCSMKKNSTIQFLSIGNHFEYFAKNTVVQNHFCLLENVY